MIRNYIRLVEDLERRKSPDGLGPDQPSRQRVIQAFEELGDAQRGEPEMAMLRVQHIMGGGVLNPVVEHVGDITHRMTHMVRYGTVLGREKIHKTYQWLTNAYGFEREMKENIASTARYRGVPEKTLRDELTRALRAYAAAHQKLPVYNKAQWLAREAAVAVGLEDFDHARAYLHALVVMSPSEETFRQHAMEFYRDADGKLEQYP